jgi:hypothetical protein
MFGLSLDLAEDGVERVLQRPVKAMTLRRPELVEVRTDPRPHLFTGHAIASPEVPRYFLAGQHGLGDVIEHGSTRL